MIYIDEQDTARVAKVILCDPSKMAWLSRFPAFKALGVQISELLPWTWKAGRLTADFETWTP
jgi:hypothetical protein